MKILLATCVAMLATLAARAGISSPTRGIPGRESDERPNVLFMLSDDHGVDTMGCEGHPWAKTPGLDRLAAGGVRFTNAFVTTSLCSPGRASFLTGMYARRHRVLGNATELAAEIPSFGAALTAAGYDSIYIGKYHMGDQISRPGFTRSATYIGQGTYTGCNFLVNGKLVPTERWVDDVATDFALAFLREERDRPFVMCLGFKAAHGPPVSPEDLVGLYEGAHLPVPSNVDTLTPFPRKRELRDLMQRDAIGSRQFTTPEGWASEPESRRNDLWQGELLRSNRVRSLAKIPNWLGPDLANYHRQIHSLDRNIVRLLDALDELELTNNTIVVYASDNGMQNGEHGLRFKRSAYEASMRIPLILRYPPLAQAGQVLDPLVLNIDLAPTLLDFAGVAIPKSMQGMSWRPLLQARGDAASSAKAPPWRDAFLYEYVREWEYFNPSVFAARTKDWKLIRYPGYPSWTELFDLSADPFEEKNLAAKPEFDGKLKEMSLLLARLQREAGPRPPAVR